MTQQRVITNLKEALALKIDEFLFAGTQKKTDEFVVDVHVDVEEVAEGDAQDVGLIATGSSVLGDHVAQLEDLLVYVYGSLATPNVRKGSGSWSENFKKNSIFLKFSYLNGAFLQ